MNEPIDSRLATEIILRAVHNTLMRPDVWPWYEAELKAVMSGSDLIPDSRPPTPDTMAAREEMGAGEGQGMYPAVSSHPAEAVPGDAYVMNTYSIANLVIFAIIVAAVVAIGLVAIRKMGVTIPDWVMTIIWIIVIALVAVFAIKFIMSAI